MLRKVAWWANNWSRGDVFATRDWMEPRTGAVIPIPTKRILKVPWTKPEFQHMIRILDAVKPGWTMTADLKAAYRGFDRCQLMPNSQRLMPMVSYEPEPKELLDVLLQAKTGQASLNDELEKVLSENKDGPLWG